jgi:hypothetical protein
MEVRRPGVIGFGVGIFQPVCDTVLYVKLRTSDLPCQRACDTNAAMSDTGQNTKRTAPFSMRLNPELRAALLELAKADKRSFTNYIEIVLEEHVERKRLKKYGNVDNT